MCVFGAACLLVAYYHAGGLSEFDRQVIDSDHHRAVTVHIPVHVICACQAINDGNTKNAAFNTEHVLLTYLLGLYLRKMSELHNYVQ